MIKKLSIFLIAWLTICVIAVAVNRYDMLRSYMDLPPYSHELGHTENLLVEMRDGIELNTYLYFPKGEQQAWPTVLIRNPYDMMGVDIFGVMCGFFAQYGYACAYQEARGQMGSGGEWEPLVNEPNDTTDTLYWIAEQNWNDGNIGMWGISYLALTQWAGALDYPPELKTFVPGAMGTDFHEILYEKGMFRHFVSLWILLMPERGMHIGNILDFMSAAEHFPHEDIDEKFLGKKLSWYQAWIRDPGLNAPTWKRQDAIAIKQAASKLTIPLLMFDGWYDPFFSAELKDYQSLATREDSRLIIGPWSHIQAPASALPVNSKDEVSMQMPMVLDWFSYYLKNKGSKPEGYAKTYAMGDNKWHTRESWPPPTKQLRFELRSFVESKTCKGGQLKALITPGVQVAISNDNNIDKNVDNNGTKINIESPEDDAPFTQAYEESNIETLENNADQVSYFYDPKNPVRSRGGSAFLGPTSSTIYPGSVYQEGLCEREDVLTFVSEAIEKDLKIAGEIKVQLLVSSDAEDTSFTAKIIDVQPDGKGVNIRDSITTLSYRNDSKGPLIYIPNALVDIAIDTWPIEWTIKKGHKLRVDISSSNFPAYNIHSNYAGPWAQQSRTKVAKQTIHSPSYISLPVTEMEDRLIKPPTSEPNLNNEQ